MRSGSRSRFTDYWKSVGFVYSFFFKLGKKARKTKFFFIFSFLPGILALVIKLTQLISANTGIDGIYIFSNMIMILYLQFLILILALFYGTSVCSEELEGKTLTYLTTRPVSKSALVLGKYAAYELLILCMITSGVVFSFFILNIEHLQDASLYKILLRDAGVLGLGLICYTAFFTLIGTFLKKSILFGLIFCFGWESVIQYFPGSTQRFAIVHYLKSLLPQTSGGRFSFLLFRLEPTAPLVAVIVLLFLTVVFLALACLVFSFKEYILADE